MYVNLLATAMDRQTAEKAHPAFVEIIRQLTPDEARLMSHLVALGEFGFDVELGKETAKIESDLAVPAGCEHLHLILSYLDNLDRLKLVGIGRTVTNPTTPHGRFRFALAPSDFGRQFYSACMDSGAHS
jgi:hypothetical protein